MRRCTFADHKQLVERITDWDEGVGYTLVITHGDMPVRDASATFRITPEAQHADVSVQMDCTPKLGPVGWRMDRMMMRAMMGRVLGELLEGLARHVGTWEGGKGS